MDFEGLLHFVATQMRMAREVHTCYEAGAFGYHLHHRLTALGVTNYVLQSQDWDERQGREERPYRCPGTLPAARPLRAGDLKAFSMERVPTAEEERERAISRQRQQLVRERLRLQAMGRSLLAMHGIHVSGKWWQGQNLEQSPQRGTGVGDQAPGGFQPSHRAVGSRVSEAHLTDRGGGGPKDPQRSRALLGICFFHPRCEYP